MIGWWAFDLLSVETRLERYLSTIEARRFRGSLSELDLEILVRRRIGRQSVAGLLQAVEIQ